MSLFDEIAGTVMGKVMGGNQDFLAPIAMEMFNQYGGLNGILDKFNKCGMGDIAASWVGTGANLPVTADEISRIIGSGAIAEMAAKFGITPDVLSSQIAQHLPGLIDKMTPNGEVDTNSSSLLGTVLSMLK